MPSPPGDKLGIIVPPVTEGLTVEGITSEPIKVLSLTRVGQKLTFDTIGVPFLPPASPSAPTVQSAAKPVFLFNVVIGGITTPLIGIGLDLANVSAAKLPPVRPGGPERIAFVQSEVSFAVRTGIPKIFVPGQVITIRNASDVNPAMLGPGTDSERQDRLQAILAEPLGPQVNRDDLILRASFVEANIYFPQYQGEPLNFVPGKGGGDFGAPTPLPINDILSGMKSLPPKGNLDQKDC